MQVGIIYRIFHNDSDIQYVGMTMKSLYERWQRHVSEHKSTGGKCSIHHHMLEHGIESFQIVELKKYNVIDEKHLKVYETLWINKLKCVNRNVSFSPITNVQRVRVWTKLNKETSRAQRKQYRETNKEMFQMKNKDYYASNKDVINDKRKNERYLCDCGSELRKSDKSEHLKSVKHNNWINNIPKALIDYSIKMQCECGSSYSRREKSKHIKSKKHINWLANQKEAIGLQTGSAAS
jgi:hypothetical protein